MKKKILFVSLLPLFLHAKDDFQLTIHNKSNKNVLYVIRGDTSCTKTPFSDQYTYYDQGKWTVRGFSKFIPETLQKNVIDRDFLHHKAAGHTFLTILSMGLARFKTSASITQKTITDACTKRQNSIGIYIGYPRAGEFKLKQQGRVFALQGTRPQDIDWYKVIVGIKPGKQSIEFHTPGSADFKKGAFKPWTDVEKVRRDQKKKNYEAYLNELYTQIEQLNAHQLSIILNQAALIDKTLLDKAQQRIQEKRTGATRLLGQEYAESQPDQSMIASLKNKITIFDEMLQAVEKARAIKPID